MSEYIHGASKKRLENLFSWSQFYSNSSLTVNRWPTELLMCKWSKESFKIERYYPFNLVINSNRKQADKIQQEIIKISNK
jgi:hypothetical protein